MRIVDLSQDIYEGMKVYPGHLKTVQFEHATHDETAPRFDSGFSFQTTGFLLNDNGPTHVDSFSHLDPDPASLAVSCGDPERATEALAALSSAGVQIADFALGQPSLDEVFLALTGRPAEEGSAGGTDDRAEGAA